MIRLVIVDDEKVIRDSLSSMINWGEHRIEVVGFAKDGEQALEVCRQVKPHLVLTDISMPKMNGTQLLHSLKQEMPQTKVIVMSGYDEFSYAQQAIKYGALDYLIKPIITLELERVIIRVKHILEQELFGELLYIKHYQELEDLMEPYFNAVRMGIEKEAEQHLQAVISHLDETNMLLKNYKKVMGYILARLEKMMEMDGYLLKDAHIEKYNNRQTGLILLTSKGELAEWLHLLSQEICKWLQRGSEGVVTKPALIQ